MIQIKKNCFHPSKVIRENTSDFRKIKKKEII